MHVAGIFRVVMCVPAGVGRYESTAGIENGCLSPMRLGLWVIFAIVFLAAGVVLLWGRGVKAVVRNAGDSTMRMRVSS